MAALDFAIGLRVAPGNLPVHHAEIPQMLGESVPNSEPWSVWMR
jgi:hypothetical protein